jgi:Ca2+/Na+ antiporter
MKKLINKSGLKMRIIKSITLLLLGVRYTAIIMRALVVILLLILSGTLFKFTVIQVPFYLLLLYYAWYFYYILCYQKKVRKEYEIAGYRRFDNTFEIHIAENIKTLLEFNRKMVNVVEYCKKENLKIEFVTGLFSYGRMIRLFGDAILLIKPLGTLSNIFTSDIVKKYEKSPTFNSDHLHRVILDPHKIKIRESSNGRKMIDLK